MNKLRVLIGHNFYQQAGGEDNVFAAEAAMLRSQGHEVIEFTDSNARLHALGSLEFAKNTIWSPSSYQALMRLIKDKRPDIAHFHNTFLMISPSAYYACWESGTPVVQSLHNYRLACPSAIFHRNNHSCEDCIGWTIPWPGVIHKCYRGSRSQTLVVATMLAYHRYRKTWKEKVAAYIVASDFARRKMIRAGLPADRLHVKPNFTAGLQPLSNSNGEYAIMIGRLSPDKGVGAVLKAWESIKHVPLKITGDGELREDVQISALGNPSIEYLGFLDRESLFDVLRKARFVVFASLMYEVFPMTIVEAYACGVPVIASRIGVMVDLIRYGETGLLFDPSNPADLAKKANWLWNHPQEATRMGKSARREYEEKYTPEKNYQQLLAIYDGVLARSRI